MADDENPYLAALAALERERADIDDMIARMRKRAGLANDAGPAATNDTRRSATEAPFELRSDTFFGLPISDAIKKYLSIVKRPKKTAEIAKALEEGGLQHTSKNWYATVLTTLGRMQSVVVRLPNGWGLREWYAGRNFDKKPPKRKKRKRAATRDSAKKNAAVAPHAPASKAKAGTLADSRQLQGWYLRALKKVPADKRDEYKAIAKRDGREKAIDAMERDYNG